MKKKTPFESFVKSIASPEEIKKALSGDFESILDRRPLNITFPKSSSKRKRN